MVPTHILFVGGWVWYVGCRIHKTTSTCIFIDHIRIGQRGLEHKVSDSDEVIKWRYFPSHRPFARGISPHRGQWHGSLMFSLICAWISDRASQSWGWWFETPSCSLWRHCNALNYVCYRPLSMHKKSRPYKYAPHTLLSNEHGIWWTNLL